MQQQLHQQQQQQQQRPSRTWPSYRKGGSIPPVLRPVLRAYVLGYASSTVPRLLTLFLTHLSRRRKNIDDQPSERFVDGWIRILNGGLELQRFPTFCAALVGGSTLCEVRNFLWSASSFLTDPVPP
jgi:hypothetical protein